MTLISTAYGANDSIGMGIAVVVSPYEDRGKRAVVAEAGHWYIASVEAAAADPQRSSWKKSGTEC